MTEYISPIIQATELLAIHNSENLVLVDLNYGINAKTNYEQRHLDGAIFLDLNTQLADIKADPSNGGRHPLPSPKQFAETLANAGISGKSHIVIYDDSNGANAAARFWWMLKSIGHEKVQVLNGGFQAAEKAGYPVNATIKIPTPAEPYNFTGWQLPLTDMAEVERVSQNENYLVIDVRDSVRYDGEKEPIDLIAGHIPGAINVPYTSNLNSDGLFLSPAELKTKYQHIFSNRPPENIIVHCGSGVTACHTLLAVAQAGLDIPKLYVGSWSEWSRNNQIIATKKNGN